MTGVVSRPGTAATSAAVPYLNLLATMVMFGSAFASSKVVVGKMPHEVAAALRFAGGGLLLIILATVLRGRSRPLGEARLLWEIGPDGADVRDLRGRLGLDSGYVSRVLRSLERQRRSQSHGTQA